MLSEALTALAAATGTGLVSAMTTDAWEEAKTRFAAFLGKGDQKQENRQNERLEQARQALTAATGESLEQTRGEQETIWRTRVQDLLEEEPERETELRALLDFLAQRIPATTSGVTQVNAQAFGQSQQAVQGQGVQTNTFGSTR